MKLVPPDKVIGGDLMDVVPPSMSLVPAPDAPASAPVTRSLTPLTVVPSCLVPLEVVVSGLARAHCPVVAVSVPLALVTQPRLVSKSSKKTVVGGEQPPPQSRMALFTFNRPPVTVLPASELIWSTLPIRFAFRLAVLRLQLESTSAAAPATCGVAIEVPLKMEKPPLRTVEKDGRAGRSEINGRGAEAGEGRFIIPVVSRSHRHNVRGIIVGREIGGGVGVAVAVAGGGDEEYVIAVRRSDRVQKRLRETTAAPTVGEDAEVGLPVPNICLAWMANWMHSMASDLAPLPDAVRNFNPMIAGGPVHAGHSRTIIASAPDRPRAVSAMIVVIERGASVGDGVEAMRPRRAIDRLAPDLHAESRRRRPDVRGQVGMVIVNACVDHADHDRRSACRNVPGLSRINVRVGRAGCATDGLACIVQPPKLAELRVVGSQLGLDDVIRLDVLTPGRFDIIFNSACVFMLFERMWNTLWPGIMLRRSVAFTIEAALSTKI